MPRILAASLLYSHHPGTLAYLCSMPDPLNTGACVEKAHSLRCTGRRSCTPVELHAGQKENQTGVERRSECEGADPAH